MKLHKAVPFAQSFTFNQRCALNFEITNSLKLLSYLFPASTNIRKGVTLALHLEHLGLFIINSYIKCGFSVVTTTLVPFPPSSVRVGCESNTLIFCS